MINKIPVIAIDGLASSGKTSVSELLSQKLGFYILDSGILYRALAYIFDLNKHGSANESLISKITSNIELLPSNNLRYNVLYNNEDITNKLYFEEVGLAASEISKNELIRDALLPIQRDCVKRPGLVANGRDMGTNVFLDAQLKIYFTANLDVRAKRRYNQLMKSGSSPVLENILKSLKERDEKDLNRDVSPLKVAKDAVVIDSSDLNIESILDKMLELYKISGVK